MADGRRSNARGGGAPPPPNPVDGVAAFVRQRNVYRAGIVRIVDSVADDEALAALTREAVEAKLRLLARQWEMLDGPHQQIVALVQTPEDIDAQAQFMVDAEEAYMGCEIRLQARLRALEVAAAPAVVVQDQQPREYVIRHRREPKVTPFNGLHENWAAFFDMFRVEVHERDDVPIMEKFSILKTACVGQGAKALGNWPMTVDNYQLAWDALQAKYDDTYAAKARLIAEIYKIPRQGEETYDGLRTLIDTPKMALRQLQSMGERTELWDLPFVQTILFKAPQKVNEEFERERRKDVEPTLEMLYAWLEGRARSRRIADLASFPKRDRFHRKDGNNGQSGSGLQQQRADRSDNGQPQAAANNSQGARVPQNSGQGGQKPKTPANRQMICWICNEGHSMYDCSTMKKMSAEQRRVEMQKKGVCIQCGRRHQDECKAPKECGLCNNERHVDIVCPKKALQSAGPPNNNRKRLAPRQN